MNPRSLLVSSALLLLGIMAAAAQQPYRFCATDYTRLADRVQASQISYDQTENSFTITATGDNNVAFGMDKSHDAEWYFRPDQRYMAIVGRNLSLAAGKSYIWWLNGYNKSASVAPLYAVAQDDGTALLVWDLQNADGINGNLDFGADRIVLTSGGASLAQAIGLTATGSKGGTITDIEFYSRQELAVAHPALLQKLGYESVAAVIAEAKEELKAAMDEAQRLLATDDFDGTQPEAQRLRQAYDQAARLYADADAQLGDIATQKSALAQAVALYAKSRPVTSWRATPTGFEAQWNDITTTVMLYGERTLRIYKSPATAPADKRSLPVVLPLPDSAHCSVAEHDGVITLSARRLTVDYTLKTGAVRLSRADGTALLAEEDYGCSFTPKKDGPFDSYQIEQRFVLHPDEAIYGLGQIQNGELNQRGQSTKLEQDNTKVCIPYWQSSLAYGLYWDNYSPTTFSDSPERTSFAGTGTEVDYYLLVADDAQGVLPLMRDLTGHCPMAALWNFGLYQSKERYTSSDQVREVARKYRQLGVPLDCMVQDWQYWGEDNYNWNALAFENPNFADGEQMIDDMHQMNLKLMISIWANFGPNTRPYKELQQMGRLMDVGVDGTWPRGFGVRPYDVYAAEARDLYWRYLYDGLVSKGVDAYWMDSTEPDYYHGTSRDYDFDYVSGEGRTWRSLRNAFPLCHIKGAYEHHRATQATDTVLRGKRVSILTRSAFAGQQRYGANTWSGDVTSTWQSLARQIPAACNLSACGIPYWNSDTGGFFPQAGVESQEWRSLYQRWTQFSCFTPMMRFHGTGNPREIYQFGTHGDADFDQVLKYVKLRYRLLPYLYGTARSVATDDATFMQALPIAFGDDEHCRNLTDEYLFGRSFLVCPIVQKDATGRQVYLPRGGWVDFWTGKPLSGGQSFTWSGPIDRFPLYLRAGSILPWGPDVQYSGEKQWDDLEVRIYPGADGSFTLYEDAGDGYEYEQGEWSEIPFAWNEEEQTLTIGARRGSFPGMLQKRTFRLCKVSPLRGAGDLHADSYSAQVEYDGHEVTLKLDEKYEADEELAEEVTSQYIANPGFEADGSTLTKRAPQGWRVDCNCQWWGVNQGGGEGNPAATEGSYLFGVWDGSATARATISQTLALPAGDYRLTVDMHASNRTATRRVGDQCVFAGEKRGLFREQVANAGSSDEFPMQTIAVDFSMEQEGDMVVGVTTANAPAETWYKIDNFRLFAITHPTIDTGVVPTLQQPAPAAGIYTLGGTRIARPAGAGLYICNGKKSLHRSSRQSR